MNIRKVSLILLLVFLTYCSFYLVTRQTPLGSKAYIATEDFYVSSAPLHDPHRTEFKNFGEITYSYIFLPLSSIDYKLNGHVYIF